MLIEFSVANFKSIKDKVCLSLLADTENTTQLADNASAPLLKNNQPAIPLLHTAVLYGQNAGGKTTLLDALARMRHIIRNLSESPGKHLPLTPFKLDQNTRKKPSFFEVCMIVAGVRYQYGFEATSDCIMSEWLYAFPKGIKQTWFERKIDSKTKKQNFVFDENFSGPKMLWKEATAPNLLFSTVAVKFNSEQLKPIFEWFDKKLIPIVGNVQLPAHYDSFTWCMEDAKKSKILDYLKQADFTISDIQAIQRAIRINEMHDINALNNTKLVGALKQIYQTVYTDKVWERRLISTHQDNQGNPIDFDFYAAESHGTQQFFKLAAIWLGALADGAVIVIDELCTGLHPLLVEFLIKQFNSKQSNQTHAQLIFTTHETHVIDLVRQQKLREDQIWFCARNRQNATELYSLLEFEQVPGLDNFAQAYLTGRYGAVPFLPAA